MESAPAVIDVPTTPLLDADDSQNQFLSFTLDHETYAVGILYVKEIIEYGQVTPVPMVPDYIRGVLNLRGNVLPVIDLARRMNLPVQPAGKHTCIVIIELPDRNEAVTLGIVVDAVNDVLTLGAEDLEPAPTFGTRIRSDFIRHIGKFQDRFITLLDVERTLSINELADLKPCLDRS